MRQEPRVDGLAGREWLALRGMAGRAAQPPGVNADCRSCCRLAL